MNDLELVARYNYDKFIPSKFQQWLNFGASPAPGQPAPDFPLWQLNGDQTSLSAIWSQNTYTIVEFGSFT